MSVAYTVISVCLLGHECLHSRINHHPLIGISFPQDLSECRWPLRPKPMRSIL
jgi:hypothetical protein